ncbi:M48 family metallopeptidase [Natronosporangium hydrolyticum]|uniref:M48 family metallopeptidase n=1 Tax=Natronosporangium hydrolyticum TaxID=2811111 RepID=A0A895YFI5_9ACTN|nr:M48 family metallopeptidase [Natronosporangium hydrolyticum]QSB14865.1 M48 family metallopeptidase [Natronosporangium hydrolyticum]
MTTARAALSVALLLGFYLYALGVVAVLAMLAVWLFTQGNVNYLLGVVIGLTLLLAGSVAYATWKVMRAKQTPFGLPVPEPRAPALWGLVRELAASVGTRPPDEIRLVAEVNAAVSEDSRWLGLISGRRYLYIGAPLLQTFTVAQLRSVLAHELGHYSHQHVRLGAAVHRGRHVISHTLGQLPDRAIAARWLLLPYAYLYFLVSAAVGRAQEIEADRASVRLAGRDAAISAMRELGPLATAWDFYLENYVAPGLDTGYAPTGVLSYFPTLLAARADTMNQLRAQPPAAQQSRWDSHPSDAERIGLMLREPESPMPTDPRPAGILIPQLDAAAHELEELTFSFGERTRLPYEHYTAATAQAERQRHADELYRAVTRMTGAPSSLAVVLDLLAAGHLQPLAATLLPGSVLADPNAATEAVADSVASAIAAALVRSGAARWQHSWSAGPALVGVTGEPIDQWQLAVAAVNGDAAKVRQELASRGVDPTTIRAAQTTVPVDRASAYAGITNAVIDGSRRDLIITSAGLIIVPTLSSWRQGQLQQRMRQLLTGSTVAELVAMPGHQFVPYEEITSAAMVKKLPATFEYVTIAGRRLTIRGGRRSEEVGDGWESLGEVTGTLAGPQ